MPRDRTRTVYVSTSDGDDAFDGLSPQRPKRSLGAGYEVLRHGQPDWLLLKRGDVWSGPFPEWVKGGQDAAHPMGIGSYGTGPRPMLMTGSGRGFVAVAYPNPLAHLALTDIHFVADRADGTSIESGVTVLNRWTDVLIENCMIESYRNNIVVESLNGRPSNIRIRRCVVVDAFCTAGWFSQGIYCGSVDGLLIEECVFDNNGWRRGVPGAHATIFHHNMYLHDSCTGVTTRGNISARASATGISQRCAGVSEDNLLLQNPVGVFLGGEAPAALPQRGALRNNVVLDSRDIDSQSPRGFAYWVADVESVEIYGNIAAHQRSGTGNVVAFNIASRLRSVTINRNIVCDWTIGSTGRALSLNLTRGEGVMVCDNHFDQPLGGFLNDFTPSTVIEWGRVFGRNRYFTSNAMPHQFYYGTSYQDWVIRGDEVWSSFEPASFPAPERDIASYMGSFQLTPTLEEFLANARRQERTAWDDRFTAAAVNSYIRAGLGVGRRQCRADFNDDGIVNALDLSAFQGAWALFDPKADVNLDQEWTQLDVHIFQGLLTAGCP